MVEVRRESHYRSIGHVANLVEQHKKVAVHQEAERMCDGRKARSLRLLQCGQRCV